MVLYDIEIIVCWKRLAKNGMNLFVTNIQYNYQQTVVGGKNNDKNRKTLYQF